MNYIQCLLVNYNHGDTLKTVAWIPEEFAKHDKIIKLKRDDGT